MSTGNEILTDLRRIRDAHAKECGYDIHRMFAELRAETEQLKTEGWTVVAAPLREREESPSIVREEPPKPKNP